ncbi:MAG: lactoylglutathione lyase [Alphaproteobacteria bacterium]|nr:lactoylglutathione lyase [Alphaproteobacteria bacterium]
MFRVVDLEKSLDFYTRLLGMTLIRRNDYESGRFTLAFVGYGGESGHTVLELTHNWDQQEPYGKGDGYGHFAIRCRDMKGFCDFLAANGVPIPRPPGPMKGGTSMIAFIEDPDGNRIELLERE